MKRLIVSAATATLYCAAVSAAPIDEHVRGKVVSITPDSLVVRTSDGANVSFALNDGTHYLQVVRSSLDKIEPGSYVGTATKDIGSNQIALEVMIFPAAMQGLNAGHFPYDRLPDTTISAATTTASMMTNGNVSTVTAPSGASVNTAMTNGNVSSSASKNGVKHLTITYNGGQQSVLVPPTAPIVNLLPGTMANVPKGAYVFVDAARDGSSLTAGLVAAGVGGLKPPF
jgi:hypothetical protein